MFSGLWTGGGSNKGAPLEQQPPCEDLLCGPNSELTRGRLEEAQDPDALAQETIIENLSTEEAHRLSRVRNIGIAVSERFGLMKICQLTVSGAHRLWQDYGDGTCSFLHWAYQGHPRSSWQGCGRCQNGFHGA